MRDEEILSIVIQLVIGCVFGGICAAIGTSRGRSGVGWFFLGFFFGCISLIILLIIPDLKVQQEREQRLANENRRLREQLKKDRVVTDQRFADHERRLKVHDLSLGVDTAPPSHQMSGGSYGTLPAPPPPAPTAPNFDYTTVEWHYAIDNNPVGPVSFENLKRLWVSGQITVDTLVWTNALSNWARIGDVPGMDSVLYG
jgi:hypothetical protein